MDRGKIIFFLRIRKYKKILKARTFHLLSFHTQVPVVQVADLTTVALTEPTILPTELPVTKIETENLTEVK